MKCHFFQSPSLRAAILMAAAWAAPGLASADSTGKTGVASSEVSADQGLSYPEYERCYRSYRDLLAFTVHHKATHQALKERQQTLLDRQEALATMRMKAQETEDRDERVQWINKYDSAAQSFNYAQQQLREEMKVFAPKFKRYRQSHQAFEAQCAGMYDDKRHMNRLPNELKAEVEALLAQAKKTDS